VANENTTSRAAGYRAYRRVKLLRWDECEEFPTRLLPAIKTGGEARDKPYQLHTGSVIHSTRYARANYAPGPFPPTQPA
jgi:hypothetical protein